MICFRGRSYCSRSDQCGNDKCEFKFTQQDGLDARRWWGSDDAPISYMDLKTDSCGFKHEDTNNV